MILVLIFLVAGLYLLFMNLGLLHKSYMKKVEGPRRFAMWWFAIGCLGLALYFYDYYFRN